MVQALNAQLIRENFTENFTVISGDKVSKLWTFKNTGQNAIPRGSTFVRVDGDNIAFERIILKKDVKQGELVDIAMTFIAPDECKHYSTGFCLMSLEGKLFGEKVWCDVIVDDPMSNSMMVVDLMKCESEELPKFN
jgi:hypothetical protein